jgi:predicted metalloendopeptidase
MVGYIHREYLKILDNVDWINEETRQKAKEKAHAITPYIGYPDELLDNNKIAELYLNVIFHLKAIKYLCLINKYFVCL